MPIERKYLKVVKTQVTIKTEATKHVEFTSPFNANSQRLSVLTS